MEEKAVSILANDKMKNYKHEFAFLLFTQLLQLFQVYCWILFKKLSRSPRLFIAVTSSCGNETIIWVTFI